VSTRIGRALLLLRNLLFLLGFLGLLLLFGSFAPFAVKVPMVPVHIWLPEAHVEAPTAGSVILAGIPSKLGTHGFLRFSIPMFPETTLCSTPLIYTPSAIAIIYTSLTTSRQIDLKKIIAYSSVARMNLVTIGMFSRATTVRSPIFSYGHTRQGQNMGVGRATHQPTSNGGERNSVRVQRRVYAENKGMVPLDNALFKPLTFLSLSFTSLFRPFSLSLSNSLLSFTFQTNQCRTCNRTLSKTFCNKNFKSLVPRQICQNMVKKFC